MRRQVVKLRMGQGGLGRSILAGWAGAILVLAGPGRAATALVPVAGPMAQAVDRLAGQVVGHLAIQLATANPAAPDPTVSANVRGQLIDGAIPAAADRPIALTFDDGPWSGTSDQILAILAQYQAKATFFMVGTSLAAQPTIAQRILAAGHALGNHTWSHAYHSFSASEADREIDRLDVALRDRLQVATRWFRPPGGFLKNGLVAAARAKGYAIVLWSQTSADTDPHAKPAVFVKNVLRDARPGNIVLMHDGGGDRRRTVAALPAILQGLRDRGYRFVTLPELFAQNPPRYQGKPVTPSALTHG